MKKLALIISILAFLFISCSDSSIPGNIKNVEYIVDVDPEFCCPAPTYSLEYKDSNGDTIVHTDVSGDQSFEITAEPGQTVALKVYKALDSGAATGQWAVSSVITVDGVLFRDLTWSGTYQGPFSFYVSGAVPE